MSYEIGRRDSYRQTSPGSDFEQLQDELSEESLEGKSMSPPRNSPSTTGLSSSSCAVSFVSPGWSGSEQDRLPEYLIQNRDNNNDNGEKSPTNGGFSDSSGAKSITQLERGERNRFLMLVFLYLLQGVPVGLAFGSIPFLLKSKLSYSQVGIFSLASYPYSLKLFWSPIVDALWSRKMGRRKTWIVPIQTISAIVLLIMSRRIEGLLENIESNLGTITMLFFLLVFLAATQDIAVDGLALTILSKENLAYASTAQTIGLNTGYFMSFTIFLALHSPDFANRYLRKTPLDVGLFSLGDYLKFWGWTYLVSTLLFYMFFQNEQDTSSTRGIGSGPWKAIASVKSVYHSMWQVVRLKHIQQFIIIHLIAKIGFQANDAVTNLKLIEKGLSPEDLAITVLIDFPFEIIFGYYAAKWSTGKSPLGPWMSAFWGRLGIALLSQLVVWRFPSNSKVGIRYLCVIILVHCLGSFMSTVQFVCINAFHTQIADPAIGGTYMTTLNTISNLGGQWPRLVVLAGVDYFTRAKCEFSPDTIANRPESATLFEYEPFSCSVEQDKQQCLARGGSCIVQQDGYYIVNLLCVTIGATLFLIYTRPRILALQALPPHRWRVTEKP